MTLTRSLLTWLAMLVVAVLNGTFRQAVLTPCLGEPQSRRLSCLTAMIALGGVIFLITRRWRFSSSAQTWWVGVLWMLLTIGFESGLGLWRGIGWRTVLADYALWKGQLWPLVLIFILLAPRLIFEWDGGNN